MIGATRLALLLSLLGLVLASRMETTRADQGANASTIDADPLPWDLTDAIDGCALCRGGNCSRAVNNESAGVFCGELQGSRQPCCCAFVATCAVDHSYDSCQCKEPDELEQMLFRFWGWGFLALVVVAFFPFYVLLELLFRVLSVVGVHCQGLRESLSLSGKARELKLAAGGDADADADARYYRATHLHDPSHSVQDPESLRYYYSPADYGCALCRNTENCSVALRNRSDGVFCGDVLTSLRPCCCAFRNECITTIFSDSCECFDAAQEEQLLNTRFYLFVVLTGVAWALLVYDKMCAGPYKVMNSNHQALASTPSAAAHSDVPTAAEDEDGSDRETMDSVGEADTLRLRDAPDSSDARHSLSEPAQSPDSQVMDRIEVAVVAVPSPPGSQPPSPSRRPADRGREHEGSSIQSV